MYFCMLQMFPLFLQSSEVCHNRLQSSYNIGILLSIHITNSRHPIHVNATSDSY